MWLRSRKKETGIGPGTRFSYSINHVIKIAFIILISTNFLPVAYAINCPQECRCQPTDQTVDCSNSSLTSVPTGIPKSTKTLILSDNQLTSISPTAFRKLGNRLEVLRLSNNQLTSLDGSWLRSLSKLKELDLSSNAIERIELLAFNGSSALQTLKLRSNQIVNLADGAFWGLTSLKKLILDDNHIEHIRLNWTFGLGALQELSIKRNAIKNITTGSFGPMRRLNKLLLSDNQLRKLEAETFDSLEQLQTLRLGNNLIEFVDENIFDRLQKVETLDLSNNSLSWALERTRGIFRRMTNLRKLRLNNNKLRLLHSNTFDGIERVKELDLSNNPLTTIEPEVFNRLDSLEELSLNSTKLFCDCSILPFIDWLRNSQTRRRFAKTVHCSFPGLLREKTRRSIFDAQTEDFDCSDRRRPVLIDDFKGYDRPLDAIKHKNIAFYCKVATSLPVKFSWIKDNELIDNFDNHPRIVSKTHSAPHSNNSTLFTNILSLSDVEDGDNGQYQCVSSNEFGVVYSHPFTVNVFVPPTFLKVPSNVTAKIGSTVRWNCSAHGQPQPQVKWTRTGKFVAGDQRRLRFDGDLFFIVNVTKEDAGMYNCSAENEAGKAVTTVSMKVVQPATFVRTSPEVVTSELGTATSLECVAAGLPIPIIEWFITTQNGTRSRLDNSPRHYFTHHDQFLLIMPLRNEDAGKYSCLARNEYGFEEVEFDLKPIPKRVPENPSQNRGFWDLFLENGVYICVVILVILMTSIAWITLFLCYQTKRKSKSRNRKLMVHGSKMDETEQHLTNRTLNTHIDDTHYPGQIEDYHSDSSKDTGIASNPNTDHYQLSLSTRNNRLAHAVPQYNRFHSLSRPMNHSFDHLSNSGRITNSLSRSIHNIHNNRRVAPPLLQQSMSHPFPVPPPIPQVPRMGVSQHLAQQYIPPGDVGGEISNFQTLPVRHYDPSQELILQQHHLHSTPKIRSNSRSHSHASSQSRSRSHSHRQHSQPPQPEVESDQEKIETEL